MEVHEFHSSYLGMSPLFSVPDLSQGNDQYWFIYTIIFEALILSPIPVCSDIVSNHDADTSEDTDLERWETTMFYISDAKKTLIEYTTTTSSLQEYVRSIGSGRLILTPHPRMVAERK